MDGDRFDQLLRSLAERPSRRAALRLLVGSILGNLVLLTVTETEAHDKLKKCKKIDDKDKRKKCVKKAKKHNATHTTQPSACATGLPRCGGDCCPTALANASVECGEGFDGNGNAGFGCTYTCHPGWEDCDGNYQNGCETQVATDPNNCGLCGRTCNGHPDGPVCCQCLCGPGGGTDCATCNSIRRARLIRA
jgi:hypothetical protein